MNELREKVMEIIGPRLEKWRKIVPPNGPQPCPHCGTRTARAWADNNGYYEKFFIEHGEPMCPAGSKKLEVFLLTDREIQAFRYWTHNAQVQPGPIALEADSGPRMLPLVGPDGRSP